jgi:hypothetical protein
MRAHHPAEANQSTKVVPQSPKWGIQRSSGGYTAPIQTKVKHAQAVIARPKRPQQPRPIVNETEDRDRSECRKQKEREELIDKDCDEDQEEYLEPGPVEYDLSARKCCGGRRVECSKQLNGNKRGGPVHGGRIDEEWGENAWYS